MKKKSSYVPFFTLCLFFILIDNLSKAQNKEIDSYVQELNNAMQSIKPENPNFKNAFLIDNKLLDDKLIIGIGESTHGTKEFANYRMQLIKELILNKNLKLVAYETDYCNSLTLNKYLLSEEKDSLDHYIINKHGLYGIYRTQEMYNLVKWIKSYNLTKPLKERVQLFGIDMQDPYAIARKISELFPQFQTLDQKSYTSFEAFKKVTYENKQKNASKEEKLAYKQLALRIKELVIENNKPSDTLELVHCLNLLSQSLSLYDDPGFFTKVGDWYMNLRDQYMSANVLWLLNNKGNGGRMALIAHNGHVAHAKLYNTYRLGYHLREAIGIQYYALGMAFDEGSVRIFDFKGEKKYKSFNYSSSTHENAYEFIFKRCSSPIFFLDITTAKNNKVLADFFNRFVYSRVIGALYEPDPKKDYFKQPLTECFDGLIFFKTTTAAENINISK